MKFAVPSEKLISAKEPLPFASASTVMRTATTSCGTGGGWTTAPHPLPDPVELAEIFRV